MTFDAFLEVKASIDHQAIHDWLRARPELDVMVGVYERPALFLIGPFSSRDRSIEGLLRYGPKNVRPPGDQANELKGMIVRATTQIPRERKPVLCFHFDARDPAMLFKLAFAGS